MKQFAITFLAIFIACSVFSQALPFKYQSVIRDADGEILPNKNVGLRVSIIQDTTATMVYQEEFNKTSDEFGIIDLEIGTGSVLNGNYLTIDWSKPDNQLKIEIDMNGGTTYSLLGTTPILSAPVANYAYKAGSSTFPPGMIMPFAGPVDKIPEGWLLCDGSEVSRTEMAELYDVVGIAYGVGNQTTTFNLPDFRGMFLRGTNLGRSDDFADPEVTARTANGFGNKDDIGSLQTDQYGSHRHNDWNAKYINPNGGNTYTGYQGRQLVTLDAVAGGNPSPIIWTDYSGGLETRPNNIYVNYIIKY